jgi:hypothetical protein
VWTRLGTSTIKAQAITAGRNADGRLALFVIGADGIVYYITQAAVGGWAGANWSQLGTSLPSQALAVGQDANGRLQVFVYGADNGIYYIVQHGQTNAWGGWQSLGMSKAPAFYPGPAPDSIPVDAAVARNPDGRLDLFVIGMDAEVHRLTQAVDGGWTGASWSQLGPSRPSQALAVGQNADGRLEVFTIGTDGEVYHITQAVGGGWAGPSWSQLGPSRPSQALAVGQNVDGRLDVFVIGADAKLYHIVQAVAGGWIGSNWSQIDGVNLVAAKQAVAVGRNANGCLETFFCLHPPAVGAGTAIWHSGQATAGGAWQAPQPLGPESDLAVPLAVAQNHDGRLEVFAAAADGLRRAAQLLPNTWPSP